MELFPGAGSGIIIPDLDLDLDPELQKPKIQSWIRIRNKSFRIHNSENNSLIEQQSDEAHAFE